MSGEGDESADGSTYILVDSVIQNSDFVPFSMDPASFAASVDGVDYPVSLDVLPDGLPTRELRNRECLVGRLVSKVPAVPLEYELHYPGHADREVQWIPR